MLGGLLSAYSIFCQTISFIAPDEGFPGEILDVTIIGVDTNFPAQESGLWASIGQSSETGFGFIDMDIESATELSGTISIPENFAAGFYNLYVTGLPEKLDAFEIVCPGGIPGCMVDTACNYDPAATCTDGSCTYPGCTDDTACNYDPEAGCDDGSCLEFDACLVCGGDGTIPGCNDPEACNYDAGTNCDDGSCTYPGCTNINALNYDPEAGCDDGSCTATIDVISIDPEMGAPGEELEVTIICAGTEFTQESGIWAGVGTSSATAFTLWIYDVESDVELYCQGDIPEDFPPGLYDVFVTGCNELVDGFEVLCPGGVPGCDDSIACNYDPGATCNDGTCVYPGCTTPGSCNYDPEAGCDDGSCAMDDACGVCGGNGTTPGCIDSEACNYDPASDCDDGSCTYPGCTNPLALNYDPEAGCDDGSCADIVSVVSIDPDVGIPGDQLDVTIICAGTQFTQESGIWAGIGTSSSTAFTINLDWITSDTDLEGELTIPIDFPPGYYDVFVTGCTELTDGFLVNCPDGYPGCEDPIACNYDPGAGCDDGSCTYEGCTDPAFCNYDPEAGCNDGSCAGQWGCMVMTACNYDPDATCNSGCLSSGCMDPAFCNYDPEVDCDNGTCSNVLGCTDPGAANYNEFAGCDDDSCVYEGCTDPNACNYSPVFTDDDGSCIYGVSGVVFNDLDENGIHNDFEPGMANWQLIIQPGNLCTYTADGGQFFMDLAPGEYTISIENFDPVWTNTTALEYDIVVGTCFNLDFGFTPTDDEHSFYTSQQNSIFFPYIHCDDGHYPGVWFFNDGTMPLNGTITVNYPPFFDVQALTNGISPDDMGVGYATWYLDNYPPGQDDIFAVHLLGPGAEYVGEFFDMTVDFTFYDFNDIPEFNTTILNTPEVVCAYDPNDKYSTPAGYTEEHHFVNPGDELEFRIRFQNTGNLPAENIILRDTLDVNFDWNTFVPEYASHDLMTTFDMDDGSIEFRFDDIFLPDSASNEPESHGFVVYTIHPKEDLLPWTVMENTAYIFFDKNAAIITNTTWHTIIDCDAIADIDVTDYDICYGETSWISASSEFVESVVWTYNDVLVSDSAAYLFSGDIVGFQTIYVDVNNPLCVESNSVMVEVLELPEADAGEDEEICEGESIELSASGGVEYEWVGIGTEPDIEVSPELTTEYIVIVTDDNGCSDDDQVTVFVNPLPTADITEDGVELTASIGTDYQWFLNGAAIDGATDQVYTATEDGDYSVQVTNEFGCSAMSDEVNVIITQIGEVDDSMILAYPNPTRDVLYLQVSDDWIYDLTIHDARGRLTHSQSQINNPVHVVDCAPFEGGTYTVRIRHEGHIFTKRIVVQ
jgi:uncharacterized repeat protein (TIGR01451 family)